METSCRKLVNKGKLGSYILHPNINYLTGPSYLDEAAGEASGVLDLVVVDLAAISVSPIHI